MNFCSKLTKIKEMQNQKKIKKSRRIIQIKKRRVKQIKKSLNDLLFFTYLVAIYHF
jgi:hypothetical protein